MVKQKITYLNRFWKLAETDNRLKLLKQYTNITVLNEIPLETRRNEYKNTKATRCKSCFICNAIPYERHHIIQLRNGGTNDKRNMIALCTKCHDKIHPWLKAKRIPINDTNKVTKFKPKITKPLSSKKQKIADFRSMTVKETNAYRLKQSIKYYEKKRKFLDKLLNHHE